MNKMKKILAFCRQETVLCVALLLAALSMLLVPPDAQYLQYIDYRTLAILFCLMSVMAGLQKIGVFQRIAQGLLVRVKSGRGLVLTLVLLCFFSSMLITNDVALLTFVPFSVAVFKLLGKKMQKHLLLPVVAMQTIGANLGSMLTPIGNPQNLYLYGRAGLSIGSFAALTLPYTLLALLLLLGWCLLLRRASSRPLKLKATGQGQLPNKANLGQLAAYLALFGLCLLAVGRILPWQAVWAAVVLAVFVLDRQVLLRVDYALLFTFVGFFIFIGNVGRLEAFCLFLQQAVAGRELTTSIIASQLISNVPAALLLAGFTDNYAELLVGVNLGGLGTLIASMASLISYKYVAKATPERKGKYIALFSLGNLGFLAALVLLHMLLA